MNRHRWLVLITIFWLTAFPHTVNAAPLLQAEAVEATVKFALVNLYLQPSQSSAVIGTVMAGWVCDVEGRNDATTWLLVTCGARRGWIDRRLVNVTGDLASTLVLDANVLTVLPPAAAIPAPTATTLPATPPPTFNGWKVSYFNNPNLQGDPVAYADVSFIDFRWGYESPMPVVPVDYFSARFERTLDLPPGYYQFTIQTDDGARLWLDDRLIVDEWHGATGSTYTSGALLNGRYTVRLEFLELVALASIRFTYEYSPQTPPWTANYYNGAPTRGELLYTQLENAGTVQLERNWNFASPLPDAVPVDFWNGRWTGQFYFEGGNYYFRARSDDGVRVYIDQTLVIDAWRDGYTDMANRFVGIGSGKHTVTVDYYDRTGQAFLQIWWYQDTTMPGVTP